MEKSAFCTSINKRVDLFRSFLKRKKTRVCSSFRFAFCSGFQFVWHIYNFICIAFRNDGLHLVFFLLLLHQLMKKDACGMVNFVTRILCHFRAFAVLYISVNILLSFTSYIKCIQIENERSFIIFVYPIQTSLCGESIESAWEDKWSCWGLCQGMCCCSWRIWDFSDRSLDQNAAVSWLGKILSKVIS